MYTGRVHIPNLHVGKQFKPWKLQQLRHLHDQKIAEEDEIIQAMSAKQDKDCFVLSAENSLFISLVIHSNTVDLFSSKK